MREEIRKLLEEEVMTTPEVAALTGRRPSDIRRLIFTGKLPHVKRAGVNFVDIEDARAVRVRP